MRYYLQVATRDSSGWLYGLALMSNLDQSAKPIYNIKMRFVYLPVFSRGPSEQTQDPEEQT